MKQTVGCPIIETLVFVSSSTKGTLCRKAGSVHGQRAPRIGDEDNIFWQATLNKSVQAIYMDYISWRLHKVYSQNT